MKLIKILEKRISDDHYDKAVVEWLHYTAKTIITKTSAHLKHVRNVLPEFDEHNVEHSEKVLEIMENLLGDQAERLSSYDIFSLIAVAYLHDCGMAVSDYEVNVMKLVEDGDFDGKKVCKKAEARTIIEKNKNVIFKTGRDAEDITKWLFYPGSEQKLFNYYAQLLIDYQTFRNGIINIINNSKDFPKTNKELRVDYIRRTHTNRIQTYIETWGEKEIANFNENRPQGKHLFTNIAKACKSHGEDVGHIRELDKTASYVEAETSNLQFVAMMLRIGDIAHFTFDRAPVVLRALHHFESDYSYEQWRIKDETGVNFSVKNGVIICNAYCDNPKDYYNLSTYVDYIDKELKVYNRLEFEEYWGESYPAMPKRVERKGLEYNDELFTPVPHLKFTLEQNRILNLLMGAKLYTDKYACLRELYQNSLDACRCQMGIDKAKGKESKGKIEFGIKTNMDGNKYLYCLDNGKGMSKYIIEHYLLKIGSSYYQSSDFYQSQASTGNRFTPTSQFGIGILSCFMIGDKIEISTKEDEGCPISCVMENIHECFYYKNVTDEDMELIPSSGTIIKIFLNNEFQDKLCNDNLLNFGYLLWRKEEFSEEKDNFSNHLYFILDNFVKIVPPNIEVRVRMADDKNLLIYDKPVPMQTEGFIFPEDKNLMHKIREAENTVFISFNAITDCMQCRTYLVMPAKNYPFKIVKTDLLLGTNTYCVDGIRVESDFAKGDFLKLTENCRDSIINFIGKERPQLSVNRSNIVNFNFDFYGREINILMVELIKQSLIAFAKYIICNQIHKDTNLDYYYKIWDYFFEKYDGIPIYIIDDFLSKEYSIFNEEPLKNLIIPLPKDFTSSVMTFSAFFREKVHFEDYSFYHNLMQFGNRKFIFNFILIRIFSTERISFNRCEAILESSLSHSLLKKRKEDLSLLGRDVLHSILLRDFKLPIFPACGGLFDVYDIVSSLYPFVSTSLMKSINVNSGYLHNIFGLVDILISEASNIENKDIALMGNYIDIYKERKNFEISNKIYNNILSKFLNRILIDHFIFSYFFSNILGKNDMVITMFINIPKSFFRRIDKNMLPPKIDLTVALLGPKSYYVIPGRCSRQELINQIPDDVWNGLPFDKYEFTDGTLVKMRKKRANP